MSSDAPNPQAAAFVAIYDYVCTVPPGKVVSYGDVGASVGETARTVGWAMSSAPEGVPWQRVVGADGYLRIAKRSPHLKALQKALLESEGVTLDTKERVEQRFFLHAPDTPDAPQASLDL
jgi:methylated-DNA-protein-cysteine methyltransferase-like protein